MGKYVEAKHSFMDAYYRRPNSFKMYISDADKAAIIKLNGYKLDVSRLIHLHDNDVPMTINQIPSLLVCLNPYKLADLESWDSGSLMMYGEDRKGRPVTIFIYKKLAVAMGLVK